jgi:predicted alpha/beta superfamily hydrolase
MRKEIRIVSLMVLTAVGVGGVESAQNAPPVTVARSVQHRLESAAIGDAFIVQIRLPESYVGSENLYPVLYVLDSDKCFGLAADTADWLARSPTA